MGKYDKVKKQMTRFQQPTEYQAKVDVEKQRVARAIGTTDKQGLAGILSMHRVRKESLEEQIKDQNVAIEAISQLLLDVLEDEGISSFKLENGNQIVIRDEVYCSVKGGEGRDLFHTWVRANGLDDLFTVNHQTMSALVKERILNEQLPEVERVPPGVETFWKASISLRRET